MKSGLAGDAGAPVPQRQRRGERCGTPRGERRGAAVVELALVAPFLAVLILGMCEVGQALRVEALLTQAARKGCATGSRPGCGNADVIFDVQTALTDTGLPAAAATISILVNDLPGSVAAAARNDKITVNISIPTSQVAITHTRVFMGSATIQSESTTMLKQG